MTAAPDPRLEAVAEAIYDSDAIREAGGDWPSWKRLVKIGSLDVDEYRDRARAAQDAINAFDAQRGMGEWPLHEEPKPPLLRRDWCEEHNRGSLAATDGLCPECETRTAARRGGARLVAVAKAWHAINDDESEFVAELTARGFLAMRDAVRAFEIKRLLDTPYQTPAASPVGAVSLTETMAAVTTEAANAIRRSFKQSSPVGADPPWLDECAKKASVALMEIPGHDEAWRRVVRTVLRFADEQEPSG